MMNLQQWALTLSIDGPFLFKTNVAYIRFRRLVEVFMHCGLPTTKSAAKRSLEWVRLGGWKRKDNK